MSLKTFFTASAFASALAISAALPAYAADNSETGGGPIDFGGRATIYLGPASAATDGGATPPLAEQDLGAPAVLTISPPDLASNDGATGDIRVAHQAGADRVASSGGVVGGSH